MKLEICVDDVAGLEAAIAGCADRVELCAALALGGLTPAPSLIAEAARSPIATHMLVRPREGDFRYNAREAAMIAADITAAAEAGLAGVVIGVSADDRRLDDQLLARLVAHAHAQPRPLSLTLHRAFDLCPDLPAALDTAVALGFDRVLTSGGEPRAVDGVTILAALHRRAAGRIIILAGSGIDASNVASILETGIGEVHASCGSTATAVDDEREQHFGFTLPGRRRTDENRIQSLRNAINQFGQDTA